MLRLLLYNSSADIPPELESQIRAALQGEWPGPDASNAEGWLIEPQLHPTYFILADTDRLRSYARTIWAMVRHQGQLLKLYGLGDVVTVPAYRRRGYGGRIVQAATAHIRSDAGADAAVLLTEPRLEALYRRSGWACVPELRVASDECEGPEVSDGLPMMLFLSARARRESFARQRLVLPGDEW